MKLKDSKVEATKIVDALRNALIEEMQRDENVVLLGEDIDLFGGAYRVTEGLGEMFGHDRVCDTPISEIAIAGAAIGAAITGLRPVAEFQFNDFMACAMDQICNQAAKLRFMMGGQITIPLVFRAPYGATGRAAQHSQSLEAWFMHTPGLKVVMPSCPYDAKGLLKTAIRDDNPVVFLEHKLLYGAASPGGRPTATAGPAPAPAEACNAVYGEGANAITVATGSPGELGLLEALAKAFSRKYDDAARWKKAGSGKSLCLLEEEKADVALVHAPEAEKQAVAEGWAVRRTLIGSNEFYLVGPKDDPAGISKAASAAEAYARIATAKATFLSRGDSSGTHGREMAIWSEAGITPSGDWYVVTKDFMMATLQRANREPGYFMTDSSTWVAARADLDNLKVLFRGDPVLVNVYHGLCRPKGATQGQPDAARFMDFLASEEAQAIVCSYGKDRYGEPMYRGVETAKAFDH